MQARPQSTHTVTVRITATRTVKREMTRYADTLLIDRMHYAGQLSDPLYAIACRLYGMTVAAGHIPRCTMRLDTVREDVEPESLDSEDEPDEDAGYAYRQLLRAAGPIYGPALGNLMAGQHPGWRLPEAQDALRWLGKWWGMDR